jgi:hypothetical protein
MSVIGYPLKWFRVFSKKHWIGRELFPLGFMRSLSCFVQALCFVFTLTAANVDAASCTNRGRAFECAPVKFGWFTPDGIGPLAAHNWWGPVWQTGDEACKARH